MRVRNILVVVALLPLLALAMAPVVGAVASTVGARREAGEVSQAFAQFGETTTVCNDGNVWVSLSPFDSADPAAIEEALDARPHNDLAGTILIPVGEEPVWCLFV